MPSDPNRHASASIRRDVVARRRARARLRQETSADRPHDTRLFAILDAARDRRIYPTLQHFAAWHEIMPLYQHAAAGNVAAVGPYLVCLGPTDEIFDWIWENGWGDSWGIFLRSAAPTEALHAHFRRNMLARTADGEHMVLRFYDPRVLLPLLPTCKPAQLRALFGPVEHFALEDDEGAALVTLGRDADRLVTHTLRLVER